MKNFRLIVALRLAIFPLILNLSFADELGIETENYVISNPEGEKSIKQISIDSSSQDPQNDNDIVPLYEREYGEAEGIFSDEEILSSSDSYFQKGAQEVNTQDFLSKTELQENLELPNLIISEVYRLWTTERIEITNISDEKFSWKLSLSWVKSSLYTKNLDIPSYTSIILADKEDIWLLNDENLVVNNAWFNIADSDEILISLIYSWNEIDTFNVDKSTVSNNQIPTSKPRPTFQKIYNNWRETQITTELDSHNITWNFIANPWKIIIKNWNPWIWNWPTDYPYNSENPWTWDSNIPWSWDISWTWNDSWIWNITWEDSDFNLIISEVFYDDDDEWIEIFNIWNWDFFWDLTLSWSIYPDNNNYTYQNIQIPAHDFLIIADSNEMFDFDWNVNILLNEWNYPQFSISDTDEIQISLLLSWQQIDWFYAHKYRVNKRDDLEFRFIKF